MKKYIKDGKRAEGIYAAYLAIRDAEQEARAHDKEECWLLYESTDGGTVFCLSVLLRSGLMAAPLKALLLTRGRAHFAGFYHDYSSIMSVTDGRNVKFFF